MTNVATIDLLNALSADRGVIVRRNAHGSDNHAPLDGIATAPDRLRAVGIADYVGFQALLKLIETRAAHKQGPPYHDMLERDGLFGGRVGSIQSCGIILCRTTWIV